MTTRRFPLRLWRRCHRLWLASLCLCALTASASPLRVLIFSGRNNHNWAATTPRLESILINSGRFVVTVTEHPDQCDAAMFKQFDAILSNWNNFGAKPGEGDWPPAMRQAFLDFVRSGGGLVIVHAGSSSFPDWAAYQGLVGGTWGKGTGHGPVHQFEVKTAQPFHPITTGLLPYLTTDELWHRMAVQPDILVLATAFSAKDRGGSGHDEPIALVTHFGKGRCFNLALGHDLGGMEADGFQVLLLRGTEWAATGKVTISPNGAATGPDEIAAVLQRAGTYRNGQNRDPLLAVERLVAAASGRPSLKRLVATKLAAELESDATPEGKQFLCWQLSLVGSRDEVPLLARLLSDTNLAYYARQGLERIPGAESLGALRSALATTTGGMRVGVIDSLANRGSEVAVPELVPFIASSEIELAAAALKALGAIGGTHAAAALTQPSANLPASLRSEWAEAQLRCAGKLLKQDRPTEAAGLLKKLVEPGQAPFIRQSAFPLYISALGNEGPDLVLASLAAGDQVARAGAVRALRASRNPTLDQAAAERLGSLPAECQVQVLAVLADHREAAALPAVLRALTSPDAAVRRQAIIAAGALGDGSTVPVLAGLFETAEGDDKPILTEALVRLPGAGVEAALLESLKTGPAAVKPEIIRVLVGRGSPQALPACLAALPSDPGPTRAEALNAIARLAGPDDCPSLVRLLDQPSTDAAAIESALGEICRRHRTVEPLVSALPGAGPAKEISLFTALAAAGGPNALPALRTGLRSDNDEVRAATVRLLAGWPDPGPLDDLLTLACTTQDARFEALAARGLARLAPQAKNRPTAELVGMIARVMPHAALAEQKALLGALAELPSVPALKTAAALLDNSDLADEAGLAAVKILQSLGPENRAEARPVLERLRQTCKSAAVTTPLAALEQKFGVQENK